VAKKVRSGKGGQEWHAPHDFSTGKRRPPTIRKPQWAKFEGDPAHQILQTRFYKRGSDPNSLDEV
jgi:hypothetical protein